jgi:5-methyltetrahydropteroyltriglutamate--homocysteine methyltransferase
MKRSTDRILTTHVGSLPRPVNLRAMWDDRLAGRASYDADAFSERVKRAVVDVVHSQVEAGIDVVSDGEQGRLGWTAYLPERLEGFEDRPLDNESSAVASATPHEKMAFGGYVAERARLQATGEGREYTPTPEARQALQMKTVCVGSVRHKTLEPLRREIAAFKEALGRVQVTDAFLPAVGPDNMFYQPDLIEFYSSQEDYLRACARAMRREYEAIIEAGLVLQIDTPVMKFAYLGMDLPSFRKRFELLVEVLNETLAGLPEDRIRLHICYGGGRGPHADDASLPEFLDIVLKVRAAGLSYDQNPRHEWEWEVWRDYKLPDGKVLIPGMVGTTTEVVEHPELVKQRIVRLARLVGRENVIAGTDCGFAQSVFIPKIHPELVWAKLKSLSDGARLATAELWP